jgi:hypothetical protein
MSDITILFLTANEVPKAWSVYQMEVLKEAAEDNPIISLSRKPIDFGYNVLDTEPKCLANIYFQMLRGAKIADTPFIGIAEDDVLYEKEHFSFRPHPDKFAYNMSRLGIFTWLKRPAYFFKNRVSNSTLIAPRKLMIEALEERFKKNPPGTASSITGELGRANIETKLGVTIRQQQLFFTDIPVIRFDHDFGYDGAARRHRKRMGCMQSYDIYYWGKVTDLRKKWRD